ncbi:MAG: MBL fold metallo-hydrolase [Beijerinckiaceae bacterium]|nr:MBL fold metallo-hydrolase [Beijerinckiaceae bacterium]
MTESKRLLANRRQVASGILGLGAAAAALSSCASTSKMDATIAQESGGWPQKPGGRAPPFRNLYTVAEDYGRRVAPTYFLRRAWVQVTRDLVTTDIPPTIPLDVPTMAAEPFAVCWLGHSALLLRVAGLWILIDPVLSDTAGPVDRFGPARLTALPIALDRLPRIDAVLISHDHYDHLCVSTMQMLAKQRGGPPVFMVGLGLDAWFRTNVGQPARMFDWWQSAEIGSLKITFVPAQHNSGRNPLLKNLTLWGGWVVKHAGRTFYYAGDTAFVPELFEGIRKRIGRIDVAAIPIGAYLPRAMMRFEHTDPAEAVKAHILLGCSQSFGVHWGTFQLGDEEPFQPAIDLKSTVTKLRVKNFSLFPIGAVTAPGRTASSVELIAAKAIRVK